MGDQSIICALLLGIIEGLTEFIPVSSTAKPAFERFGANFLARGGALTELEGKARARNVVIEFPSVQHAIDCYNSPEYQAAAKIRQEVADAEMVIVEGI